jgi:hypothetical protein
MQETSYISPINLYNLFNLFDSGELIESDIIQSISREIDR